MLSISKNDYGQPTSVGTYYSDIKRKIDANGGVYKLNNALEITIKDYAVDKDLNDLTMVIKDDIEFRMYDNPYSYNLLCKQQNTKNPWDLFMLFDKHMLWYGSNIFKVVHNMDISFIRDDGTLYRDSAVLSFNDFDTANEWIEIEKSKIVDNTIYVPEYKRYEWWLSPKDVYRDGKTYLRLDGAGKLDNETYKTGFVYKPDMSSGHIKLRIGAQYGSNGFYFFSRELGSLKINKTN